MQTVEILASVFVLLKKKTRIKKKFSFGGMFSSANVHIDINVLASGYNGFYDITKSLNLQLIYLINIYQSYIVPQDT